MGKQLGSEAILADAECTRVCIYMSIVLLAASAVYELTHIAYIDVMGTLGLAWFSFSEGRECFEKAAGKGCCPRWDATERSAPFDKTARGVCPERSK